MTMFNPYRRCPNRKTVLVSAMPRHRISRFPDPWTPRCPHRLGPWMRLPNNIHSPTRKPEAPW